MALCQGEKQKDNIIKALLLTQASCSWHIESLLLSTGAEKAFDRVGMELYVCDLHTHRPQLSHDGVDYDAIMTTLR